jgi:hypothetical protein
MLKFPDFDPGCGVTRYQLASTVARVGTYVDTSAGLLLFDSNVVRIYQIASINGAAYRYSVV